MFPHNSLYSIFSKCMISCVIVFDGRVTRVVYDDTRQWLLESCVKLSLTAVVVEIFISKLGNSGRCGKINLSCNSV